MSKRQLAIVDTQGRCHIIEEDIPTPGQGEVLIRLRASMISPGTQLGGVRALRAGDPHAIPDPQRLGYQGSGTVAALGEGVTQFKIGDRVACLGAGAGHSTHGILAQNLCTLMPDDVTFEEASCMNLTLTAMQAYRRAEPELGQFMLILGLGVVGQMTGQIARAAGQYVMGWDMLKGRRDIAEQMAVHQAIDPRDENTKAICDAFTDGLGFDNAVFAIGGEGTKALRQVQSVMKVTPHGEAMGSLIMVGGLSITTGWGANMGNLDVRSSSRSGPGYHDHAWERGNSTYPNTLVRWTARSNMKLALRMIAEKKLNPNLVISHTMPLGEFAQAVELLLNEPDKTQGVVLVMN